MISQIPGQITLWEYTLPQVSVRLRLEEERPIYSNTPIDTADRAVTVMQSLLQSLDREAICCVMLDTKHRPICFSITAIGGLGSSIVDVPNTYKAAILTGKTAGIIMFHNHPSGVTEPSQADIDVTRRISLAGQILGIPLVDHIIVGGGVNAEPRYSIREHYPNLFEGSYSFNEIKDMLSIIHNDMTNVTDVITETVDIATISHGRSM